MEEQSGERGLEGREVEPHVIRLRGRWKFVPLARTVLLADGTTSVELGSLPPAGRVQLPANWDEVLGSDFLGRVRFSRHFHRPTGLTSRHWVYLVLEKFHEFGEVKLNGRLLGSLEHTLAPHRFDITAQITQRNELAIEIELPRVTTDCTSQDLPAKRKTETVWIGDVSLEICEESPEVR